MNKGTAIIGFLLCFVAGMGLMWGVDRNGVGNKANPPPIEDPREGGDQAFSDDAGFPPVSSKDPTWGSRRAPVTLVLFSDFQCPFCTRVEATLNQIKERYGQDKVRIVWKNNPLPFHKAARPAALAAETVFRLGGSKAFWKFHELAFANQKDLEPESFEAWAAQAGVDRAKFKAKFAAKEYEAKIDQDMQVGKTAGVSGTPASFVNGVLLSGAQPLEKFTAIIDEELGAAKAAVAAGTKLDTIYVKRSAANRSRAPAPTPAPPAPPDDKTVWKVPVGKSMWKGKADALVTIVQFSDYQCPFCSRVEPTIDEIMKAYPDKVRVVWKDNPLPFHPRAEPAAELAMEASAQKGDKGFWAAHDLLFKNQQRLSDEDLLGYAKDLGLDAIRVKAAIADKRYSAQIAADQGLAKAVQASGTPHFFVNGRRLVGAQPFEKFKGLIEEEIKKAEALLARGIAAKDLYAELQKAAN